jgi:hypothetical protein
MSKSPIRTASGLNKPASRLTLEDLFGPGPLPSPEDIARTAKAEAARNKARKAAKADPDRASRLAAIKAAAEATARQPEWTKHWHPTARVFIQTAQYCCCGALHKYANNKTWLIEYTNSRTDATHTLDPAGPVDMRLPAKIKTLNESVAVCPSCVNTKAAAPQQGAQK